MIEKVEVVRPLILSESNAKYDITHFEIVRLLRHFIDKIKDVEEALNVTPISK